jgi:hypothetical protein
VASRLHGQRLAADHPLRRLPRLGLTASGIGIAACVVLGAFDPTQVLRSYLVAFLFWLGIALGALATLSIHHVTGGAWGVAIRRPLEAAAQTLPLLGLLFVPIALAPGTLYEWAHPGAVAHDAVLAHKAPYLNAPFFVARAVLYFAAWILLTRAMVRWSREQDAVGDVTGAARRLQLVARGSLVVLGLTGTFASIDWIMSLEPHWFSTIYGILFMGGCVLSALAFAIPVTALVADRPPFAEVLSADVFHDLGKLLLAFVLLWAYFSFSQFLIIWSGNLPEEISWYLHRSQGGWTSLAVVLLVVHFAAPFAVLLSRTLKRRPRTLAVVALALLAARYLDLFWLIVPAFEPDGLAVHALDPAALVAIGGAWLVLFARRLVDEPPVPLRDESLPLTEADA